MTVQFRDAVRQDVPAVVALLRDDSLGAERETAVDADYFLAWDAMQTEQGNTLIVGEAKGRIVATFQLTFISGLSLRAMRRAQIESVRVAADLRGQGIGHALLAEAETRARAAGCRLMQLTTNATREDARRFYAELGYAPSHVGFKKAL